MLAGSRIQTSYSSMLYNEPLVSHRSMLHSGPLLEFNQFPVTRPEAENLSINHIFLTSFKRAPRFGTASFVSAPPASIASRGPTS